MQYREGKLEYETQLVIAGQNVGVWPDEVPLFLALCYHPLFHCTLAPLHEFVSCLRLFKEAICHVTDGGSSGQLYGGQIRCARCGADSAPSWALALDLHSYCKACITQNIEA